PFCQGCKRMRLTSTGQLIPCLARGTGPNVRHLLKDDGQDSASALQEIVAAAMAQKCFRSGFETQRPMVTVGG
ncbi:MAG: hypothetical protein QF662_00535, partial [Phycisphaerae bacterium]|nr:hypothetical protein [Phycisphaerae bacterium]